MRYGVLQFLKGLGALLAALLVSFSVYLIHASSFTGGESTYYLYSASSQAQIKQALSLADLAHLKGESAVYVFKKEQTGNAAGTPVNEYAAMEEALPEAGASAFAFCRGFYLRLRCKALLRGRNRRHPLFLLLFAAIERRRDTQRPKNQSHIAVRAESVAVGTPIIFGGIEKKTFFGKKAFVQTDKVVSFANQFPKIERKKSGGTGKCFGERKEVKRQKEH